MSKHFNKIFILLFGALLLLTTSHVLAGDYGLNTAAPESLKQVGGGAGVAQILGNIAGAVLALSGSIFMFLMVYGGVLIMTAAGNQGKIDQGKKVIIWAIIGALILGAGYAITALIFGALAP